MARKETVYVRTPFDGNGGRILHLSEECQYIRRANNYAAKSRHVFPDDQSVCKMCSGEHEPHTQGGPKIHRRLSQINPEDIGLSALGERRFNTRQEADP